MSEMSALTLVHGRTGHLRNLMRGLRAGHALPGELVIAAMSDEVPTAALSAVPFLVRQVQVTALSSQGVGGV